MTTDISSDDAVRFDSSRTQRRAIARSIVADYLRLLNTTPWSINLAQWISKFGNKAALDTFQEVDWQRWPFEKYCFRTRVKTDTLTSEYSFYDNDHYLNPKPSAQGY